MNISSTIHTMMPSLNALRAFEAAARHLSFKDAATELSVSASAVGHLIADLEDFFGVALFERVHRKVHLTVHGQQLALGLHTSFDQLRNSVRTFRDSLQDRPLTLSVEPTFALQCLIPRLESFRAQYPDITIRIEPNHEIQDPRVDDVDVCIRYGDGNYPCLDVFTIAENENIVLVCSPDLATGKHPLSTPQDIAHHTLIDRPKNVYYQARVAWQSWFKAAGMDEIVCKGRLEVSYENYAILSAIQGHGVTLVNEMMVLDDLNSGRLVKPFDISFPVDIGYHLVTSPIQAKDPRIQAFKNWIIEQSEYNSQLD